MGPPLHTCQDTQDIETPVQIFVTNEWLHLHLHQWLLAPFDKPQLLMALKQRPQTPKMSGYICCISGQKSNLCATQFWTNQN
jgi:hypothetical protein